MRDHRATGFNSRTDFLSPWLCPQGQSCWKNENASLGMPPWVLKFPDAAIQLDTGRRSRVLKAFDNRQTRN